MQVSFCTDSILYRFHLVQVLLCTGSILFRFHSVQVPFFSGSILYRFHSIQVPFKTCSILFRFHSVQVSFYTGSMLFRFHFVQVPFYSGSIPYRIFFLLYFSRFLNYSTFSCFLMNIFFNPFPWRKPNFILIQKFLVFQEKDGKKDTIRINERKCKEKGEYQSQI